MCGVLLFALRTYVRCCGCVLSVLFFFSSRRRHTRCALVTGVQTCALPIVQLVGGANSPARYARRLDVLEKIFPHAGRITIPLASHGMNLANPKARSEERRVGKECVSTA